jgi:predicted ArsR family transcriptional regulator
MSPDTAPRPRDALAPPLRAELFQALTELCRPVTTQELASRVGRHHNSVRTQLQRLAAAGLIERRVVAQRRGRPRDMWAVSADAEPGGRPPDAHAQLSGWLARALAGPAGLEAIEATGRQIGNELAAGANGRPVADGLLDALAALGFMPRSETAGDRVRFVLRNCPYREAVLQNQPAICVLHRGITRGLLDRLGPAARLTGFVANDPLTAGCLIEVAPE